MQYDKYIKFAIITVLIVALLLLLPIFIKLFLPFILAFLVAFPCQRIINILNKKLKINRGISSALIVTGIVALVSWILVLIFSQIFEQIKDFVQNMSSTIDILKNASGNIANKFNEYYIGFSPKIKELIDTFSKQLSASMFDNITPFTTGAISLAKRFAVSLPDIVVFFFMFLLSTFFITKDYTLLVNFFNENCPEKLKKILNSFKSTAFSAFLTYLRAQLILMSITFTITTIALWILGADYPLVMGLIIGFVDALPFFGTAIILIPWAIISFVMGNYFFAGGLIIVQVIAFVTRQLLEPKVISAQIGLHPLVTLVSIYLGLNIFGVGGIIIGPVTALFLTNAYVAYKSNKDE